MRARWLLAALALALPAAAAAQAAPPEQTTPPQQTPQTLFTGLVVNDPRTSTDVRGLLTSGAAFVGSPPQFADLTGDGRMDAVVQVRIPGAAGTVAVYAFSTDGTSDGRLRAVLRSQALYRATVASMLLDLHARQRNILIVVTHSERLAGQFPIRFDITDGRLRRVS